MRSRQQGNRWSSGRLRNPNPERPQWLVRIALIRNSQPVWRETGRAQHDGSIVAEVALHDEWPIASLAVSSPQPDLILAGAIRDVGQERSIRRPHRIGLISRGCQKRTRLAGACGRLNDVVVRLAGGKHYMLTGGRRRRVRLAARAARQRRRTVL